MTSPAWKTRKSWRYALLLCLLLSLSACGQKGPLYLPQPGDAEPAEAQ